MYQVPIRTEFSQEEKERLRGKTRNSQASAGQLNRKWSVLRKWGNTSSRESKNKTEILNNVGELKLE